jgi:tRNA-binding EMAP/Myf-like protein
MGERRPLWPASPNYTPETLTGRQVIVVANPARQVMGVLSQGMLLAAGESNGPVLVLPGQAGQAGNGSAVDRCLYRPACFLHKAAKGISHRPTPTHADE